jgi:hypothetical protein
MSTTAPVRPALTEAGRRTSLATILALARVEGGRLVRHPAFLVGLAASLAATLLRSSEEEWAGQSYYLVGVAWGFTWMGTLVAAALVAGRQRLLGDPDLFPATPVSRGDRVLATALALCGPVLVAAAAVTLVALLKVQDGGFILGEPPYARAVLPPVAEWVQPVLLVGLAGVVGIAVAQLRRGRLPALLLLTFATFVGGSAVWMFQAHPFRVLHPFMYPSYDTKLAADFTPVVGSPVDAPLIPPGEWNSTWRSIHFDTAALHWHLLYVAGLILLGIWWAKRAADRGEPVTARWLLLAGVPLLLVGGIAQILTAGVNP